MSIQHPMRVLALPSPWVNDPEEPLFYSLFSSAGLILKRTIPSKVESDKLTLTGLSTPNELSPAF